MRDLKNHFKCKRHIKVNIYNIYSILKTDKRTTNLTGKKKKKHGKSYELAKRKSKRPTNI